MQRCLVCLFGLLVLTAPIADAAAERRVALVIGNGAYTEIPVLSNPPNDANDIAETLEKLDFNVIKVVDGDKPRIEESIRDFGRLAADADVALFFYAGHGLQVAGENYLVPTTARMVEEQDLDSEAINVKQAQGVMDRSGASVKILVLDACRDNPLARNLARASRAKGRSIDVRSGLAELHSAEGTLIAFATAPEAIADDGTGRNSPFTAALLHWIVEPGLEIGRMFRRVREEVAARTGSKQIPWVRESLLGDFYFAGSVGQPTVAPPRLAALSPPSEPELEPVETAYVAVKAAIVREQPSVRSTKIATLKRGSKIHVAGKLKGENWYLIQRDDGRTGYVFGDLLMEPEEARIALALPAAPSRSNAGATLPRDCPECPELVVIPAGSFTMGSRKDEDGRSSDEGPRHQVKIPRAFALGKYEVTRAEFATFARDTGHDPSGCFVDAGSEERSRLVRHYQKKRFGARSGRRQRQGTWRKDESSGWHDPGFSQSERDPVVCVNWDDAQNFVEWLSRKTGQKYRLPSESEWEYASRAGTTTARYWGDSPEGACRYGNLHDQTGKSETGYDSSLECRDGYETTAPVGSFTANGFGLHDMLGNALEWVRDCYADSYSRAPRDGSAWTGGACKHRVVRGGSWTNAPSFARSALRGTNLAELRLSLIGFRVAKTLR